jgi:hypothetical protein
MGGTGVAITTDALATYWNPGGLAMDPGTDVRFHGGGVATDRVGIFELFRDTKALQKQAQARTSASLVRITQLLDPLSRPGVSASAATAAGGHFKTTFGNHAIGFHLADVAYVGGFFSQKGGGVLNTQMIGHGLEARQAAMSYAYVWPNRTFSVGTTVKLIQGVTYSNQMNVRNVNLSILTDARTHSALAIGVDAGLMYRPTEWLLFGAVGKDLNTPTFAAPDDGRFQMEPQFRAGMAVKPYDSLLVTADVDLNSNRTLVPSVKSQALSIGAEHSFFATAFFVRGGAIKNMADARSIFMPTIGFGLHVSRVQFDIGGGVDFRGRQAMASFSAGVIF